MKSKQEARSIFNSAFGRSAADAVGMLSKYNLRVGVWCASWCVDSALALVGIDQLDDHPSLRALDSAQRWAIKGIKPSAEVLRATEKVTSEAKRDHQEAINALKGPSRGWEYHEAVASRLRRTEVIGYAIMSSSNLLVAASDWGPESVQASVMAVEQAALAGVSERELMDDISEAINSFPY